MEHHEHILGEPILNVTEGMLQEGADMLPVVIDKEIQKEVEIVESEALNVLSPLEAQIAEEKLNNIAPKDIAKRLGISDKVVRIVLGRRRVQKYIKDVFDSVTAADKENRIQLMAQVIENKIAEEGISSDVDLANLLQMLDSMLKVKEQSDLGTQNNVMINVLNQITKTE